MKTHSLEKQFSTASGWFDYVAYLEFVKTVDSRFSKSILKLLPPNRFDMDLKSSFCDSLLGSIGIHVGKDLIELAYLGPYFDRSYTFRFSNVSGWKCGRFLGLGGSLLRLTVHQRSNDLLFVFRPKRGESPMTIRAEKFCFEELIFSEPLDRQRGLKWTGADEIPGEIVCKVSSPEVDADTADFAEGPKSP